MTSWTDQFSSTPIGIARPRYRAISFSANTTLVWPEVNASSSSYVADVNDCTPSAGSLSLTMPDATLVSTGRDALFSNLGADSFTLKKSDGTSITTVTAGSKVHVYLTDNSTSAGSWRVTVFGATSAGADASALDGPGLTVISTELAAAHTVSSKGSDYTILTTDRAKLMKWTGGAGTFTFTAAATLGDNWFCLVSNQGSGVLTLDGNSSETIDGDATKAIQQDESCIVVCDGSNLFTVGYGRAVASSLTRLSKSVAGSTDVTLTASEAASVEQEYTGALTGNINVIVPVTVAQYLAYNNTTGAYTLTVKTTSGTGIDIPQGTRAHVYCDGTNVVEGMDPKRLVNAQTGTTYTVLNTDRGKLVTHTNASAIAVTLPQAGGSAAFTKGWFYDTQNRGAGAVTITPTTSTIDGAASITLNQNQGCRIFSDGTNYFTQRGIGFTDPMTTRGDIIYRNASAAARLAVGAAGTILRSDGTDPAWATVATALGSLVTTRGDLITRDASTPVRLAVGAADRVLTSDGTDPAWAQVASGMIATGAVTGPKIAIGSDAQGDILYHNGTAYTRLGAGTNGQFLQTQGAGANPQWASPSSGWTFIATAEASASASVDFTSGIGSTYDAYAVVFSGVNPATDGSDLQVRVGAGSFDTGSNYKYAFTGLNTAGTSRSVSSGSATVILMGSGGGNGIGNASTESGTGTIIFGKPASTALHKIFKFGISYLNPASDLEELSGGGAWSSASAMDRIQFFMSSGNVAAGRFTLFGIKHS